MLRLLSGFVFLFLSVASLANDPEPDVVWMSGASGQWNCPGQVNRPSLQSAIDTVAESGEVRLLSEATLLGNNARATIYQKSVIIKGGFESCDQESPTGMTTLNGSEADDDESVFRILNPENNIKTVQLSRLNIVNNYRDGDHPQGFDPYGGAIIIFGGVIVVIADSSLSGSSAELGGAIYILENRVGEDISQPPGVQLTRTSIRSSRATDSGGGIYCDGADVSLREGSIIGGSEEYMKNTAVNHGGGIFGLDCKITIDGRYSRTGIQRNVAETGSGGGIYLDSEATVNRSMMLGYQSKAIIADNSAAVDGGGIHIAKGRLVWTGGEITGNSAGNNGGGVSARGADSQANIGQDNLGLDPVWYCPSIYNPCTEITGNSAYRGGGVDAHNGGIINIGKTLLLDNTTTFRGSAMYAFGADAEVNLENSAVVGSTTTGSGKYAIRADGEASITFHYSTLTGTTQASAGTTTAPIGMTGNAMFTATSCIIHGNHGAALSEGNATIDRCIVEHAVTGNLVADPLFIGEHAYHISPLSPAVGYAQGSNSSDIDQQPRKGEGKTDAGADQSSGLRVSLNLVNGGECAYSSIGNALASAHLTNDNTITILPGAYEERLVIPGNISVTIEIGKNGDCTETDASADPEDTSITFTASSSHGGVVFLEQGSELTMRNLTVANGQVSADGGNLFVSNNAKAYLDNVLVDSGTAVNQGGGVMVDGGELHLLNGSVLKRNFAMRCGGIAVAEQGKVFVEDNSKIGSVFEGNEAEEDGGGICLDNGNLTMRDSSRVSANTAGYRGGGIFVSQGLVTMEDSSVVGALVAGSGNEAALHGGGAFLTGNSSALTINGGIIRSGMYHNISGASGGGIELANGANLIANNGLIRHNTASNGAAVALGDAATYTPAATLIGTIIRQNVGGNSVIANSGGVANFQASIIRDNVANDDILRVSGESTLTNVLFYDNSSKTAFSSQSGDLTIESSTLVGDGEELALEAVANGTIKINNSIVEGFIETASTAAGGIVTGKCSSDTNEEIGFGLAIIFADAANNDYRQTVDSDGVDYCSSGPDKDYEGNFRPFVSNNQEKPWDVGAFEIQISTGELIFLNGFE